MALTVLPSDGFITRLLQQAHSSTASNKPSSSTPSAPAAQQQDQMSISSEARQATQTSSNHRLESKLMELYNQRGEGA